jgi:hypothetical protein
MRSPVRFTVIVGAVVALALLVWSGARAAKGSWSSPVNNGVGGVFLSSLFAMDTTSTVVSTGMPGTGTPVVTTTAQGCDDDQDEEQVGTPVANGTPGVSGAPQGCDDDQGEDQGGATAIATGTSLNGDDGQEDQSQSCGTPVAIGTPQAGQTDGDDQGEDQSCGSQQTGEHHSGQGGAATPQSGSGDGGGGGGEGGGGD